MTKPQLGSYSDFHCCLWLVHQKYQPDTSAFSAGWQWPTIVATKLQPHSKQRQSMVGDPQFVERVLRNLFAMKAPKAGSVDCPIQLPITVSSRLIKYYDYGFFTMPMISCKYILYGKISSRISQLSLHMKTVYAPIVKTCRSWLRSSCWSVGWSHSRQLVRNMTLWISLRGLLGLPEQPGQLEGNQRPLT